jgi:large subunit ribosomal protein L22
VGEATTMSKATVDGWSAIHRTARISERKVRLVLDLIRGRHCNEALQLLKFTNKRACVFVNRVLQSAMANANENSANMNALYVAEARADSGPIVKRFQPKDRGRAHPIQKRTSHIVVTVLERD